MRKIMIILAILVITPCIMNANVLEARSLDFDYEVYLENIPQDALELKLWIPILPETDYQIIEEITFDSVEISKNTEDLLYENRIHYVSLKPPFDPTYKFVVSYKIKRLEHENKPRSYLTNTPENSQHTKIPSGPRVQSSPQGVNEITSNNKNVDQVIAHPNEDFSKFLKANRLVTLSDSVKEIAEKITEDKETTLEKARAIYDYIYENVSYDKTIPGWGNGDTQRVCNIKAGNCTDFHSFFISLSRASGIPAKFKIGVPLILEEEGEQSNYHCWAEFYDQKLGWIPVDISEAWKDKSKHDYYFGTLDENRLEFTQGRDIILQPRQAGEPLNYFIYPYAEVDGEIHKGIGVLFKYKNRVEQVEISQINN